jgi:hypothetical protein
VRLAGADVSAAETVGDLLRALDQAHPARMVEAAEAPMAPLPLVPPAVEARTLIEVLEWHATAHPDRLHLAVLGDEVTPVETFTYRGPRGGRTRGGIAANEKKDNERQFQKFKFRSTRLAARPI